MSRIARTALVCALIAIGAFTTGAVASASTAIGTAGLTVTARGQVGMTGSGIRWICTWTLQVTLPRAIAKSAGTTAATINSAGSSITSCNPNTLSGTIDNDTPVLYSSFSGTLPNITGINGTATGLQWTLTGRPFPGPCNYTTGTLAVQVSDSDGSGGLDRLTFNGSANTPLVGCIRPLTLTSSSMSISLDVALTLI